MRQVLIVVTRPVDPLSDIVTSVARTLPETRVEVADLTVEQPDYRGLLAAIFAAESVQVW